MLCFLAAEPPLQKRRKIRVELSSPEWLRDLLRATPHGKELLAGPGFKGNRYDFLTIRRISQLATVVGLARVSDFRTLGTVFDIHDREEDILYTYSREAVDSYSMTISALKLFSGGPVTMISRADGEKITWRWSGWLPNPELLAQRFDEGDLRCVCQSLGFADADCNAIPVISMPKLLLHLAQSRSLSL